MPLMDIQYYLVALFAAFAFVIALHNLRFLDSLGDNYEGVDDQYPDCLVSVLVPARNEEGNIGQCLQALTCQSHQLMEILVLDDRSTDRTAEVIEGFARVYSRVKIIVGAELPSGWTGKNWACHQLSQAASGDLLLFIDSDTVLSPGTVSAAVRNSIGKAIDLLTVMPRRIANCIIERLLFPFIDWASFSWMPMRLAHGSKNPHLSATFGPFMLFKRKSYEVTGGHAAIRNNPFDDFELGRMVKRLGMRWALFEGADWVNVRAYDGNMDAFKAISRSIFPAVYYRLSLFALLSVVLFGIGFLPLIAFAVGALSFPHENGFLMVGVGLIGMVVTPWLIVCRKFKHGLVMVPCYPFSILLMLLVALHSVVTYSFGFTHWKERRIEGRRVRL